ncbi:MAG TPA: endonuclease III [Candidatus Polarisedimenticolia bacterium]|nr:endonuclease III [Candidatus Polarisedimenticolia bacterium]
MPHRTTASSGRAPALARRRAAAQLERLRRERPDPRIELDHRSPFELLVATILSAQCTDARVNQVTPVLFRAYPTARAMARARLEEIEPIIRSTGFFRAKARAISEASREIVERHGGEVPASLEELTKLPGVGRKTANVILGGVFGMAEGIVVDTHMARVARRLGWTRHDDPVRIERDLMALVPRSRWIFASIALVLHGRYVCVARRPRCPACVLSPGCPSRGLGAVPPRPPRGRGRG